MTKIGTFWPALGSGEIQFDGFNLCHNSNYKLHTNRILDTPILMTNIIIENKSRMH